MIERLVVTADEVKSYLKQGEPLFFVEARHASDWDVAVMKVRGALRLPDDDIESHLSEVPGDRPVVVYSNCPGENRSLRVAGLLQEKGWKDVHVLKGGFKAYLREGLPVQEIGEGEQARKMRLL